jgi:hypothetical protein
MYGFYSRPKPVIDGRATKEVVAVVETSSLEVGKVVVVVSPADSKGVVLENGQAVTYALKHSDDSAISEKASDQESS